MEEFRPGQVISPQGTPATPSNDPPSEPPVPPTGAPEPERPTEAPPAPAPVPAPDNEAAVVPADAASSVTPQSEWQYAPEVDDPSALAQAELPPEVEWTASEFIAHEKGATWYGLLTLVGAAATVLIYLLTKDKISTGVVVVALLFFGLFAARKPKTQHYRLDDQGLQVGAKTYYFQSFKTFSIDEEGAVSSIILMPLKRFMPPLTVYVAPEEEEQVVNYLSAVLPFDQHKPDAVDSLLRRIRF